MMNELVEEELAAPARGGGLMAALRRALIAVGLRRPSFADKVEGYRRGSAEERRARRQAVRCTDSLERARTRIVRMARRLSDGGIDTTLKFWPIAFRIGVNRKERKFGFAELRGSFLVATRSASGLRRSTLPFIITAMHDKVTIQPSFAGPQQNGRQDPVIDLFVEVAHSAGDCTDQVFCEKFENALARAVAAGRLIV